jgi:hypothetical protein
MTKKGDINGEDVIVRRNSVVHTHLLGHDV